MVQGPRHCLISSTQYKNARKTKAKPPVNSANELVQRFLLIGNQKFHIRPLVTPRTPISNMRVALTLDFFSERSRCPVRTPIKVVAIAGIVLMIPSGSRVTL